MAEITGPSYIPRGTKCKCTMGATEQRLNLLVDHGIIATASREPLMNANDHVPMVNIMPFGFCKKGMPCMPLTPVAWVDVNKKHIIDGAPALTEDSKLACAHGGVITIVPLDAGSAEEGDRNENAGGVVENIALALGIVGGVLLNTNVALAKNLMKMNGKKSIVKSVKGGVNKGKGSNGDESKKTGASTSEFANAKKLDQHYEKHVKKQNEFGNITKEEYLEKANKFIKSDGPNILTKKASNGDILKYDKTTDEFSIVTKDGVLRTYHKLNPKIHNKGSNLDYWNGPDCTY